MKQIKRLTLSFLMAVCIAAVMNAVPAKRGLWRTVTLKNGKQVKVELVGDEHFHFFRDSLGNAYVQKTDNSYVKKSQKQIARMQKKAMKKRAKIMKK